MSDDGISLFDHDPLAKPSYWPLMAGIILFLFLWFLFIFAIVGINSKKNKTPVTIKYMDDAGWHITETTLGNCRVDGRTGILRYNGKTISQGLYVIEPVAQSK